MLARTVGDEDIQTHSRNDRSLRKVGKLAVIVARMQTCQMGMCGAQKSLLDQKQATSARNSNGE